MDRRGICTGKHVTEQACDERDMCTGKTYDQTDMQAEEICKMKRQVDWNGMCNEMGEGMSINIFKDTMAEMTYEQIEELVQKEAIVLFPVGISLRSTGRICLLAQTFILPMSRLMMFLKC